MAKTKRKVTPAQKAALTKGRAKLAAKRGRPKLTPTEKKKRAASSAYVSRKSQAKNFTDTPKKKARRAKRRRQNMEPGYYPNPSKSYYLVMGKNSAGKTGYFNGTRRLSTKAKAQDFRLITLAKQTALNLAEQFPNYQWFVETVKKKKKKVNYRSNPESRETMQAAKLYEDFTGHQANRIDTVKIPAYKSAVEVGTIDGIMYTTRRDGEKQHYIHRFKQSARPIFAVSPDGKCIFVIGGNFKFTERGIVDN